MDKDKLNKANELSNIISRLEKINSSLDWGIADIGICGSHSETIHAITNSSKHSELERIENAIVNVMVDAGRKFIEAKLKTKQQEFNKL